MSTRNRNGLTRIDVAILLILMLVLGAMFAPWVLSSHERLRQMDCMNRLKQVGLALHTYEEAHNTFPPGWIALRRSSSGEHEQSAYGWTTYILPFLDQPKLYQSIAFDGDDPSFQTQAETAPSTFAQQSFQVLTCPTNYWMPLDSTSSVSAIATTSYVANFGVGIPTVHHDSQSIRGVFGCNSRIRIRDIRDGVTNVIFAGERMLPQSGSTWPVNQIEGPYNSYWPGIPRGTSPLAIVATVTDGDVAEFDDPEGALNVKGQLNGLSSTPAQVRAILLNKSIGGKSLSAKETLGRQVSGGFSSYHPGGARFLLGDASVRYISDNVDPTTYINLMRRSDGETLGEF